MTELLSRIDDITRYMILLNNLSKSASLLGFSPAKLQIMRFYQIQFREMLSTLNNMLADLDDPLDPCTSDLYVADDLIESFQIWISGGDFLL